MYWLVLKSWQSEKMMKEKLLHLLRNMGLQVFNGRWHKSYYVIKCVGVEHSKKLLT